MSKTTGPSTEGKTPARGKTPCPKHPDKHITLACIPCKILICEYCKPDHGGHDVKPCTTNGKLVQNICRAQTQIFYDTIVELENLKDEQDVYKEAKTEVNDKIQQIIKEATELQKRINDNLDEASENRKKKQKVVCENIKTVDDRIGLLNNIRNVKDPDVLIPEAVNNAVILKEFALLHKNTFPVAPALDTILPYLQNFDCALKMMKKVFKVNTVAEIEYDYTSVTSLGHVDIPDSSTERYIICDTGLTDKTDTTELVLGAIFNSDLRAYDILSNKINRKYNSIKQRYDLVKISSDKYAAVDSDNNLQLMDDKGVIVHTEQQQSWNYVYVCYHSIEKIIKLKSKGKEITLSRIGISSNKFVNEHETKFVTDDQPWFIASHKDENTVSMVSHARLYTVNMTTSAVDTHDISGYVPSKYIYSLYVDRNDNVLVGDNKGKIHMFDKNMKHHIVAEVKGEVWGITIRNDVLIATANAKIWRFKLSTK